MKKFFLVLLVLTIGFFAVSCDKPNTPVVPEKYTLPDLAGKTEAEITQLFEGIDIVISFRYIETDDVEAGYFIGYVGLSAGDQVDYKSTVRVEIAKPVPYAPTISGADDVTLYVSVQGNPPTFDLEAGVTASDFQGNNIPFGPFFSITSVKDSSGNVLTDVDYYKLGDYTVTYTAINSGFITNVDRVIHIVVPPFDTNHTDDLRLTASYIGKSFINDGIGIVTVSTYTDGDTTKFYDPIAHMTFTVRYLGIDAPEATSSYEPWGIPAASFVYQKLSIAETIILQAEGDRMDGNGRYLAWVWYIDPDTGLTRLLNLELVEEAYAFTNGAVGSQYENVFTVAAAETQLTGMRIYGELDPGFDYSIGGTAVSIGDLLNDFDSYVAKKVTITGVITSKVGQGSFYIEQDGHGIYVFAGYHATNELQIGYQVTIQGLVPSVFNGGKQVSNYSIDNMQLLDTGQPVVVTTIMGDQLGDYVGRIVSFDNLTIQSVTKSNTDNAYTVVTTDDLGNNVNLRVDDYTSAFLFSYQFVVGHHISVIAAPVTQYYQSYQLMIPGTGNIDFKD